MTMVEASNKSDALASIKMRFASQKQQALKKGFKWTNHVDKFEYVFTVPGAKGMTTPEQTHKEKSPAVWELIRRTEEDGSVTYSAKKHDKPLMTEEDLKIALFASAVNK